MRVGGGGGLSSLPGCATVWSCAELPLTAKNTSGKRGQGRERWRRGRERERVSETGCYGGMQRWSGECSVAYCTVLCSPFPSSWHHPEHEHFFNHSRESRAEPSGGRLSHCSVCSHHPPPPTPPPSRHCHATQLHVSSALTYLLHSFSVTSVCN